MTEKLAVFISYKREDQAFAEELWQTLIDWGYDPWLDVKNIRSGISRDSSTWIDSIHQGLKRCAVLIGVITPDSLRSQNVRDEWYWARANNRRILLLRLKPFDSEDMPHTFVETDYIDLCEDRASGLERLRDELVRVAHERKAFVTEMTPPAPPAPPEVPDYLLDKPTGRRYVPWRLTLRFLGVIAVPITFLWMMVEPGFDSLLAFLGAVATLLGSFVGEQRADSDLSRTSKLSETQQMRKRIYQYWVQGVMQTALKEVEAVGIGLNMQPEAVVRDSSRNVGDIPLANDSRHVRQVYDALKSFLILGDRGAGKTIMLLQLAESLILSPPPTHKDAIPLVLNLSSWSLNPKPLHEWLEDETWRTYRVRGSRARDWLRNNQLILLLDGLDEVKEEQRAACVQAINTFRQERAHVPLVVCSRIEDYERLGETRLALPGAILLEALSTKQVEYYLSDPGLAHLRRVVARDPVLQEMATTPFLLNTMIYAYRHEPEAALTGFETEAARRDHLFSTYVQRRLADDPSPYKYDDVFQYLEWLATKMQAYVQTVFRPEDIQRDWVADDEAYIWIMRGLRATYTLILTLLYAAVGWRLSEWVGLLSLGIFGAGVGYEIARVQRFRLETAAELRKELKGDRGILIYTLLASAFGLAMLSWLSNFMPAWGAVLLTGGLLGALSVTLFGRGNFDSREMVQFSVMYAGIGAVILGFLWGVVTILRLIWLDVLIRLMVVLAFLQLHQYVFEDGSEHSAPDVAPTTQRVLVAAVLAGLAFSLLGVWLGVGMLPGVAAALTYAGLFNGLTLLHRPVLWLRLRQRKVVPLRLTHFLHAMTERQIMRQMGGGYIFIHRYLLENFAGVDEIYVLFEELKEEKTRVKAQEILERLVDETRQSTLRTIQSIVSWDNLHLHPIHQRLYGIHLLHHNDAELPDNRPGVDVIVREDGLKLPDIAWSEPIPPGEYLVGGDERARNPLPAEMYRLRCSYQVSKYPVTNAQFQVFIDAGYNNPAYWTEAGLKWKGGRRGPDKHGDTNFRLANHPRGNVTWYEAMAYCAWLTEVSREVGVIGSEEVIRLPREKEWEIAARGPEGLLFPYGNDFDSRKCNTDETGIGQTSVVWLFPLGSSWCGAEDMSFNVGEWCLNLYDEPDGGLKPEKSRSNVVRGLRGGSWAYNGNSARAASRFGDYPDSSLGRLGFRLLRLPHSS